MNKATSPSSILISVVIPHWNHFALLDACLAALAPQVTPRHEVIVVDNGSTDGSPELLERRHPWVRIIRLSANVGFSGAVNRGAKASSGQAVAVLNNDTRPAPDWLAQLEHGLAEYPDAGFFGCRILREAPANCIDSVADGMSTAGYGFKEGWGELDGPQFDQPRWITAASAAAALYRRKLLDETGGFDESYFAFEEDLDLALRAQLLGYRCRYLPAARVVHRVRATAGPLGDLPVYLCYRNLISTLIKTFPGTVFVRCAPAIVAHLTLAGLNQTLRGRGRAFARGVAGALRRLPRTWRQRRQLQLTRRINSKQFYLLLEPR